MAEEQVNTPQADDNSVTNPSTQANETKNVPYGRFQEVNRQKNDIASKYEEATAKIAKMEAGIETARQESLKKNQEYETLYNEAHSMATKLQEQNKVLQSDLGAFRQGLVDQLPEERRVYTEGMNMATLQKFVQEEQVAVNANKTDSSRAGTTAKGEFGGYGSYAEWAEKDSASYEKEKQNILNTGLKIAYSDQ